MVWSLSYEMVFYLLLTALFIARVHKRSSWYALGFAAAAVAIGGLLPQAFFTHNVATPRLIALVADLAVLAGLAFAVVLRGTSRLPARRSPRWWRSRCSPSTAAGSGRGRPCRSSP